MADYPEIAKRALERYRSQQTESDRQPFPRRPRCTSFALYRKNKAGAYICLTCDEDGTLPFSETVARRIQ
jgi:hypothetical protein